MCLSLKTCVCTCLRHVVELVHYRLVLERRPKPANEPPEASLWIPVLSGGSLWDVLNVGVPLAGVCVWLFLVMFLDPHFLECLWHPYETI